MLKKILMLLFVLIVVTVMGFLGLIYFVDPNSFKNELIKKIEKSTDYTLTINGDLRWHLWPRVSLLTDAVVVQKKGAQEPLMTADNMRLDVAFFPLFSKRLTINHVLVKSAVVSLTENSKWFDHKKQEVTNNPTNSADSQTLIKNSPFWSFDFEKVKFIDGVVVWQQGNDLINFRNIDLYAEKKAHDIHVNLQGNLNRNRHNLTYSIEADVDTKSYPATLSLMFDKFDFDWQPNDSKNKHITGSLLASLAYQLPEKKLIADNVKLTVGEDSLTGRFLIGFNNNTSYALTLFADKLDLSPFISLRVKNKNSKGFSTNQRIQPVFNASSVDNPLRFLRNVDIQLALKVNQFITDGLRFADVKLDLVNQNGITKITALSALLANGQVSLTAESNNNAPQSTLTLQAAVKQLDLSTLLSELSLPNKLSGILNANGNFVIHSLTDHQLFSSMTGNALLSMTAVTFGDINLENIIQTALPMLNKSTINGENIANYTKFDQLSAQTQLKEGMLTFDQLNALSSLLRVNGSGSFNLLDERLDMGLSVFLLKDFGLSNNSQSKTLKDTAIPVQIFGNWDQLQYEIDLDQLWKKTLSDKVEERIEHYLDKLKNKHLK